MDRRLAWTLVLPLFPLPGATLVGPNPVLVRDAAGAGFGGVDKIALTASHSVVRRTDGTVWAWGYNGSGQLGDTATVDRRSPVRAPVSGP